MFNLLTQSGTLGYGIKAIPEISLNWIGQLIRILIEGIGIVGVGIIIFTLILKTRHTTSTKLNPNGEKF